MKKVESFIASRVKQMAYKIDIFPHLPSTHHYSHRARTGYLSVRIILLSGILDHGAGNLVSPSNSTMKSP